MNIEKIFHGKSDAGSGSTIDVIRNEENGLYAIIVNDETGYADLIVLDKEMIRDMSQKILEEMK